MERHSPETIHGDDASKRLILYPKHISVKIVSDWKAECIEFYLPTASCAPTRHMIEFKAMKQTNIRTCNRRTVKRIVRSKSIKKKRNKKESATVASIALDQNSLVSPLSAPPLSSEVLETNLLDVVEQTEWYARDAELGGTWWDI